MRRSDDGSPTNLMQSGEPVSGSRLYKIEEPVVRAESAVEIERDGRRAVCKIEDPRGPRDHVGSILVAHPFRNGEGLQHPLVVVGDGLDVDVLQRWALRAHVPVGNHIVDVPLPVYEQGVVGRIITVEITGAPVKFVGRTGLDVEIVEESCCSHLRTQRVHAGRVGLESHYWTRNAHEAGCIDGLHRNLVGDVDVQRLQLDRVVLQVARNSSAKEVKAGQGRVKFIPKTVSQESGSKVRGH